MGNRKDTRNNIIFRTIMIIGIVVVLNLILSNFYWHIDLTEDNIYSLSPVTKRILRELDDIITIKVYFSKELPTHLALVKSEVRDLLNDFSNYSGGKIRIDFKDPEGDDEIVNEVAMLRIPKLQFSTVSSDEYTITDGYLGMALFFEDKREVLPVIQNTNNLEYELIRSIKHLQKGEKHKIYFAKGHGETDLDTQLRFVKEKLEEQYQVSSFDITSAINIPDYIDTLVIVGPKHDFNDKELYIIDQLVMQGRGLLVLSEGVKIGEQLQASVLNNQLNDLLDHYGIKLNNNLVLDQSRAMAPFSSGFITFSVPYPFWPKIVANGFNSDNVMVSKLESLVLPWTSSLTLQDSSEGREIISLVMSGTKSWLQNDNFNLDPNVRYDFDTIAMKEHTLSGFISGDLNSYFTEKQKPELDDMGSFIRSTNNGRVIVVGNSKFIEDVFLRTYPGNLLFAQNIIDGLTQDSDLINIRSRGVTDRPIKELSDSQKNFWKYFNIFAMAIIVILYGIIRSILRRKSHFEDKLV